MRRRIVVAAAIATAVLTTAGVTATPAGANGQRSAPPNRRCVVTALASGVWVNPFRVTFVGGTDGNDGGPRADDAHIEVAANEVYCGFAGDDFVSTNSGIVIGGSGDDSVFHNSGLFDGGPGYDVITDNGPGATCTGVEAVLSGPPCTG